MPATAPTPVPRPAPFVPNPRPVMVTPAARRRLLVPRAVPGRSVQAKNARTTWTEPSRFVVRALAPLARAARAMGLRARRRTPGRLTPRVELPQVVRPEPVAALALASRLRQARIAGPIYIAPGMANARVKQVVPASPPPSACRERTPVRPVYQCAPRRWPGAPTTPAVLHSPARERPRVRHKTAMATASAVPRQPKDAPTDATARERIATTPTTVRLARA